MHIIDAARVMHETVRGFYVPQGASHPTITAAWGDLPQDKRDQAVKITQKVIDGDFKSAGDIDNLRAAVGNALRPFVEE